MASRNFSGNGSLCLAGAGAAYIRVSTDQQDTQRQFDGVRSFEERHGVTIADRFFFKDEGWSRDETNRPDFKRLIGLVQEGLIQWIVVERQDRFGVKNADEWGHYRYLLREAGCKLYRVDDTDLTADNTATRIITGVEAERSEQEQREKSHRGLSGKIVKARQGEWQGGPTRLGFDVVCFDRATETEKWRVIFDGYQCRLKVYPSGERERFDGPRNFPATQPTEVLRIGPSRDKTKLESAVSVFKRYAAESISFAALADHLNRLGFRNCNGREFQSGHVKEMLSDPAYLGFYSYNKRPHGKFTHYRDGQFEDSWNYDEKKTINRPEDYIQSERRLFPPLVDRKTWEAVQKKLSAHPTKTKPPRSAKVYLAGLLICGNCGRVMYSHSPDKPKYFCSSYFKHVQYKRDGNPPCFKNLVFQDQLEEFIDRWLDESGTKLDLVMEAIDPNRLSAPLQARSDDHWAAFGDALKRMNAYLAEHHPDVCGSLLHDEDGELTFDLDEVLAAYRRNFSPAAVTEELERLEADHTALVDRWTDLPTPRAKEKVKRQLAKLEARIEDLERQRENVADEAERHYREWKDLRQAIRKAKAAMGKDGERGLRRKAEALQSVIHRIECHFTATGSVGRGKGKNAELAKVVFHPVTGETSEFTRKNGKLLHRPVTTVK